MRIACVGAGPAGLYFSLLMKLGDQGHDVTVFERSKAATTYGWGVTYGDNLLQKLYVKDPKSAGEIQRASVRWREQVIHIQGRQLAEGEDDAYNINRQRLLDILAARSTELGVNIHYDREVLSRTELPPADLVIAADGANSRIRQDGKAFHTDIRVGRNKYIWLGTGKVFGSFSFFFVQTDSGRVWAHAYGIDSASSTFLVECSPQTWAGLGFDRMSTEDALVVLKGLFRKYLDGHDLIGESPDGTAARWLNFRNVSNQRWHDGNIVLAGDSAHTTHFSVGLGTTLAIEDVIVLADRLQHEGTLESALQSYETQRQADLLRVVSEARNSAQWFENVDRYAGLKPHQFAVLLHARRSPLVQLLPPRVSYQMHQVTEKIGVLHKVRDMVGPVLKVVYGRRRPVKVGDGETEPR